MSGVNQTPAIAFLSQGWRPQLETFLQATARDLILAAPFIKSSEAAWITANLQPAVRLTVLTDVNVRSVESDSLDLSAHALFAGLQGATVVTLPRLHAKVLVADDRAAIVTSANFTGGGLDHNYEYGALVRDVDLVARVKGDTLAYLKLGNRLGVDDISRLHAVGMQLQRERRRVEATMQQEAREVFNTLLRRAQQEFLTAQVGRRSANSVFGEAIKFLLRNGPLTTQTLAQEVQQLHADLCDDTEELVISGERYGKAWKHRLRNAQQHLKRRGDIAYDAGTQRWSLVS